MDNKMDAQAFPPATPRDIRLGMTKAEDVAFPLRWGILGAGDISRQWVLALRACKGATLAAVAARSYDRAKAFAAQYGVGAAYGSYAEMLASPDVDIIYIGTIGSLHKAHTLMAIAAGKHVLCEKALAENVADAREMYAAALQKNVMLQDGVWTRFFPAVEHARTAIEAGIIGDIVLLQADFDPLYTSQAVTLAFGDRKPIAVTARGRRSGGAILEYDDSKFAILTFITFNSEFAEVTEIVGTKGRITLEQPGHCPTALTIRVPPRVPSRYMAANTPAPTQRFEYPLPESVSLPGAYPNQQGFLYQAEAIHRCLAAGLRECPQYGQAESLYTLELLERINASRRAAVQS
jgi:dihydrodiol dehydrogenase / D-xylose 1-dehydrogenase (NADP)